MTPQTNTRRAFLTHADQSHPVYGDPGALTVFQYCQFRCRSSSASVQHQNSYRRCAGSSSAVLVWRITPLVAVDSRRMYCYGVHRPLKVLPTVNSDGLHEEWLVKHCCTPPLTIRSLIVLIVIMDTIRPEAAAAEAARDQLVPAAQLEYDPFYRSE